ncbi:DUF4190 domain-containing protein [Lewinella sp. W8]|uniref:DUF4190 domain-containing protein n=1 Tax=Lewinella sp. W8 TaxID=2528208 RepID=UPI001C12A6FB|nr:DUF4190 domain-containing protein [Lewinella sp. W8]
MKLVFLLPLFLVSFAAGGAAVAPAPANQTAGITLADLDKDRVEARLGRKLKFREKVGLWILKKRVKRQERRARRAQRGAGPVDGLALASFICGILGFLIGWPAIAALVLGIVSLSGFNRNPGFRTGKGFAIAGIVLGGVVILAVLTVVAIFASGGFL